MHFDADYCHTKESGRIENMVVPSEIITLIKGIPSKHFDELLTIAPNLKKLIPIGKNAKEFLLEAILKGDKAAIQALYEPLSLVLAGGGCCGGPVGIVFNLLDAAFCFILGNWIGFSIDILSALLLFPGAKAVLTGITEAMKILPKLLVQYGKGAVNIKILKIVIERIEKAGELSSETLQLLFNICEKHFKDQKLLLGWLAEKIAKFADDAMSTTTKTSNQIGYGLSNVGKKMTKSQEELRRGINLSNENFQPQTTVARYLFIKPLNY